MSKIDDLINKLCPDGVEYKTIQDLCNISRGRVMSKDYIKNNIGDFPVYSSQTENNGELGKIATYDFDGEYLTWTTDGANAGSVFYRNGKFSVTNVCGLLEVINRKITTNFLYYVLSVEAPKYVNSGMGNPKLMSNVMSRIKVPVPPIEVQREIVNILDTFEEHIECLKKELILREESYESIMHQLLKKENFKNFDALENYCSFEKGKTPIQKNKPGNYPLVATTEHLQTSENYQFDCEAVCLPLISARGHGVASITRIYYQSGKFALGNILCAIIPKDDQIKAEFLRNYLFYHKDTLLVPLMRGGANVALTIDSLKKVQIPIPSVDEQQNIIEKLRPFQDIISKENGIPAEIEKRQTQYEYYKNKLLSFKEVEVNE